MGLPAHLGRLRGLVGPVPWCLRPRAGWRSRQVDCSLPSFLAAVLQPGVSDCPCCCTALALPCKLLEQRAHQSHPCRPEGDTQPGALYILPLVVLPALNFHHWLPPLFRSRRRRATWRTIQTSAGAAACTQFPSSAPPSFQIVEETRNLAHYTCFRWCCRLHSVCQSQLPSCRLRRRRATWRTIQTSASCRWWEASPSRTRASCCGEAQRVLCMLCMLCVLCVLCMQCKPPAGCQQQGGAGL